MVTALILAAGRGTRMQADVNKIFLPLFGQPLVLHTLQIFQAHPLIDSIILVAAAEDIESINALIDRRKLTKVRHIVPGGETRQESCWLGLQEAEAVEFVAVHDCARPLIDLDTIRRTIEAAKQHGAALAAVPCKDTLKESTESGFVAQTPDRRKYWQAQTPQVMRSDWLRQAHQKARQENYQATDEASLIEYLGQPVKLVQGNYQNLKVTTQDDLSMTESLLKANARQETPPPLPMRVGLGQDSHRFVAPGDDKPLLLGGVLIEGGQGLAGNSDADVVLHALFNALSQAMGGRSLGYYAGPMCLEEGITDSREYLKVALQMVQDQDYVIGNVGISIECLRPRIEPWVPLMKDTLADLLDIWLEQIGITATSGEHLTDFGRGDGIQTFVTVSLFYRSDQHA